MNMTTTLRQHLPEYLMEAGGLGTFMLCAGVVSTAVLHPTSPIPQTIGSPFLERVLIGLGMGLTAIGIIYSPWGKQSGAHINPSVTLTFFRLGKVSLWDATFYILFQFMGGLLGILLTVMMLGDKFTQSPIHYIVTVPGSRGVVIAFVAELIISCGLMMAVLWTSNHQKLARFTGVFAGFLVMLYVIFESPLSGFSMNPARTFASALPAGVWTALWLYFLAPPLGMLLAAEFYVRFQGPTTKVFCAKLHHQNKKRCIHCEYQSQRASETAS
jgi:aquaporin Z